MKTEPFAGQHRPSTLTPERTANIQTKPAGASKPQQRITDSAEKQPHTPDPSSTKTTQLGSQALLHQIAKHYGLAVGKQKQGSLEQRADKHKRVHQARKQQNLEAILDIAAQFVDDAPTQSEVDPDWLFQFFNMAEEIFSSHMQALWGRILAAQLARPESFSLRSLIILKQMTKRDAVIFQHAVELSCRDKYEQSGRVFSGLFQPPAWFGLMGANKVQPFNLSQHGLSYPDLLSLIDLDLFYGSEIETGSLVINHQMQLDANGAAISLVCKKQGAALQYYKMTQAGYELSRLIKVKRNTAYFEHLAQFLSPVFDLTI